MTLIAILIALALERYLRSVQDYRRFDWLLRYGAWVQRRIGGGAGGVLLVIGPPVLLIGLLQHGLGPLLGYLFAIAILVLCLGPKDIIEQVDAFIDARERTDQEGAFWYATEILGGEPPTEPGAATRAVTGTLLVECNDRLFAILFWFLVLGPLGAALLRLASLLRAAAAEHPVLSGMREPAQHLYEILCWIPARLTAISYALSGSFVDALNNWRDYDARWAGEFDDRNLGILSCAGLGALQLTPGQAGDQPALDELRAALALARRALIVWIALIAVMTLAGWAG